MTEQLSIFDFIEDTDGSKRAAEAAEKEKELKGWALVYLVKRHTGYAGNLFILPVEDAQKLCEDECSHGTVYGNEWMFNWTTVDHFVKQNDQYDGRLEDFVFIRDSGRQDKDFERLGIQKPILPEQSEILHRLGYVMVWK